ncbi:MAG: hypothetical protein C5B51_08380 [Terriglobia bacterium]|nr:MAG: hypothetical protein C5B51_08380 [Terriglobia bacterium]
MPELKTPQDLVAALGGVVASEDPIAELKRRGFTLSNQVQAGLSGVSPGRPVSEANRKKFAQTAAKAGIVRFHIGTTPRPVPRIAPDDYDAVAAVSLSSINRILAGLFDSFTIPHQIDFATLLEPNILNDLADALSIALKGIPRDAAVSDFQIRSAPTVTEVNGTDRMTLHVPFTLDFARLPNRTVVTSFTGTLNLVVQLSADVALTQPVDTAASITLTITIPPDPSPAAPSIDVDPASPVQPRQGATLTKIANILQRVLGRFIGPKFTVSPVIHIPGMQGLQFVIQHIDVRANSTLQGGLAVAGIRFTGGSEVLPNPAKLTGLVPEASRNTFIRIDDGFIQRALDAFRASGGLDKLVQKKADDSDLHIESVNVKFARNEIRIHMEGVKRDACLSKDVSFTILQSFTFRTRADRIEVDSFTDISVDTADKVFCYIVAGLLSLLASLPILLASPLFGIFVALFETGILVQFPDSSGGQDFFPLDRSIPGTELLPTISNLTSSVGDGTLTASFSADFKHDEINTYIYLRVLNSMLPQGAGGPLSDASVEVCDLDVPAPTRDDAKVPEEVHEEKVIGTPPKFIVSVDRTFEPPTTNPVLAKGGTNFEGRVMFSLTPSELITSAGVAVVTNTTEDFRTGKTTNTRIEREPVLERFPDLFFRISRDGATVDTHSAPDGFFLNFKDKRIGQPAQPHTVTVRLSPGAIATA